jgi:hypothetical protein
MKPFEHVLPFSVQEERWPNRRMLRRILSNNVIHKHSNSDITRYFIVYLGMASWPILLYKVSGLLLEMVLNATLISLQSDTLGAPVRLASHASTKKGRYRNIPHIFIGRLSSRLWAALGASFARKSLSNAGRMARRKGQRKKRPSVYCNVRMNTISSM